MALQPTHPTTSGDTREKRPWSDMSLLARQSAAPTFGPNAKFIYFKHLPRELRLDVWGRAALSAPVVHTESQRAYEIPAVLQLPLSGSANPHTMLFSAERDGIAFPLGLDMLESGEFLLSKIQYLLIKSEPSSPNWLGEVQKMVNIRKVIFYSPKSSDNHLSLYSQINQTRSQISQYASRGILNAGLLAHHTDRLDVLAVKLDVMYEAVEEIAVKSRVRASFKGCFPDKNLNIQEYNNIDIQEEWKDGRFLE